MSKLISSFTFKRREHPKEVLNKYNVGEELGKGAFGVVKKCLNKETGKVFAMKIIDKRSMDEEAEEGLEREVDILQELDHDNIIRVVDVFDSKDKKYIVTEFVGGGELFERIKGKATYSERDAATLVKILLEALAYCASKRIVHRDLKPENLLLISKTDDTSVKIADFGFAAKVPRGGLEDRCGTLLYVAPEVVSGKSKYGTKCDMWSLGVIAFLLLTGKPPLYDENMKKLMKLVRKQEIVYDPKDWDDITPEGLDFVQKLLNRNTKERMSAKKALEHPWLAATEELPTKELSNVQKGLADFQKEKLKAAFAVAEAQQELAVLFQDIMSMDLNEADDE